MVAQNAVRKYGVNQLFRLVEGIWLHQKTYFYFIRAQHILLISELFLIMFYSERSDSFFFLYTVEGLNPDPVHLRPDPVHLRPNPVHLRPDPVHLRPDPVHLRLDPVHLRPDPQLCPV